MFHTLTNFYNGVKSNYNNHKIPKLSGTLISSLLGLTITGKILNPSTSSFSQNLKSGVTKLLSSITINQPVPTLPTTDNKKPICIFDLDNFLIHKKFSILNLKNVIYKRPYSQTFLFHMAHFYELVMVTEHDIYEGQKIMAGLDPYGCVTYRVFLKDKRLFTMANLNRGVKQLINIKTKDHKPVFNDHLSKNTIEIPEWKGEKDNKLLDLLSFCTNMAILDVPDFRNTIMSYKKTPFFDTFNFVQKKIFKERNMFTWNYDKAYNSKINEINKERIETFEKAKLEMEQQIMRDRLFENKYEVFTKLHNIVLNLVF